jgi:hypothetical protein
MAAVPLQLFPTSSSFSPHLRHHQPSSFSPILESTHGNSRPVDTAFKGNRAKKSLRKFDGNRKRERTNVFDGSGETRSDSFQQETLGTAGGYQGRQDGGAMKRMRVD